jgi:hypothetical protein
MLVYALASPAPRSRIRGIAGEPLRAVTVARVTAIVADVRRSPRPTRDQARRFDAVMRRLAAVAPSLLPVRFGTVVGEEELAFILKSRGPALLAALRHVRNRVQMTTRVFDVESHLPNPESRIPRSGAEYLRQRAARARVAELDPLRGAVRRWVRDERVETRGRIVTLHHLVPRTSADAYRRALERAAGEQRRRVIMSGPHPAYAFAETE